MGSQYLYSWFDKHTGSGINNREKKIKHNTADYGESSCVNIEEYSLKESYLQVPFVNTFDIHVKLSSRLKVYRTGKKKKITLSSVVEKHCIVNGMCNF